MIAVLRALSSEYGITLGPGELARLALAVEVEELGITAGLQDRLTQAHGGLLFMDFSSSSAAWEPLDPASLPPLVIAWRPDAATDSGTVHATRLPVATARALGELARTARAALLAGDDELLRRSVDGTFDPPPRSDGTRPPPRVDDRDRSQVWRGSELHRLGWRDRGRVP